MGSKIELFRITVYIFFPVGVFYYFNNPQFFEKYVTETQRKLYPPADQMAKLPKTKEDLDALKLKFRNERFHKNTE